jgi:hypothetical protein
MGEDIAREPGGLGHIDRVVAFELLALGDDIAEAEDGVQPGEDEAALPVIRHAEARFEGALADRERGVALRADQEDLADLVGGERQRHARAMQPGGEAGRGVQGIGQRAVALGADQRAGRGRVGGLASSA